MAGKNTLVKSFFNDKGLDLRSSDLVRNKEHASGLLNTDYRKTGALNKRKGYQSKTDSKGGSGSSVYANVNIASGDITEELVVLDSNLHKLLNQEFIVTYTGSGSALMTLALDATSKTFKFILNEDDIQLLSFEMGTGINEASTITVANLKTAIDFITNFSSSYTSASTTPAAFLNIQNDIKVTSSGTSIPYNSFEAINAPLSNPLATTQSNINTPEFKNATFVNLNNILYVGTGYDSLYKYDGQTFYKAGMPTMGNVTTVINGAGSITNSNTKYISTYIQKDNKGNIIEGIPSEPTTGLNTTSNAVDVTINNIDDSSGFNTNCGIMVGVHTTQNILNLDDGAGGLHTLEVGDTAYFYDSVSIAYVEREITATTSTTITVAGAAVTTANNAVISNNLRIAVYRNIAAGSLFYFVEEYPNDSFNATQVIYDSKSDALLGGGYIYPYKQHGLPPKGRYLTVFRNILIIGGKLDDVNSVSYSDLDGPEYFPAGDNSILVETNKGDKVTGIATTNNALFIFKDQSIHVMTGDINTGQFRVDIVSGGDVGCVSHHTISEIKGKLIFLGKKGVFGLKVGANEPEEMSFNVEPIFRDSSVTINNGKATSLNWYQNDKYILFLPSESTSGSGDKYTNLNDSKIVVLDYSRSAWLEWNNIDMQGGAIIFNDAMYFTERRLGTISTNIEYNLYNILDMGDLYDYADHSEAIECNYKTHWESLGEPDMFKKFIRLKVHSLDASINNFESDEFSITVQTQINYIDAQVSTFVLTYDSGLGWGLFEWGDTPWGSSRNVQNKSKLKSTKAQSIRIVFSNNIIHENILISGWTLEANMPYKTRIKE